MEAETRKILRVTLTEEEVAALSSTLKNARVSTVISDECGPVMRRVFDDLCDLLNSI